jgi:signal transduction histidine kinase
MPGRRWTGAAGQNGWVNLRAVLGPLISGTTYRRGVFLLLGGVILLPYVELAVVFGRMLTEPVPHDVVLVLIAAAAVVSVVPAFLRGARALEIAATRALLGVDLPHPAEGGAGIDRETRLRAALWYAAHLAAGGVVALALLIALPMALVFVARPFGIGAEALVGVQVGPFDERDTVWLTLIGVALLAATGYLVAGLGALAAVMAPVLLGPSQTERIAVLEAQALRLAERNRLARELHDSIGHALTVATLQAGAARELLDSDPEFARRALAAIEETGRAAMDELDHVLGLLRERDTDPRPDQAVPARDPEDQHAVPARDPEDQHAVPASGPEDQHAVPAGDPEDRKAPQRTLADLDRLVADTRATGLPIAVEVAGAVGGLPAVLSREGYRIVQEGLTNAARHGGRERVTLRVAVPGRHLEIDLVNPVRGATGRRRRGRGLDGMRERVTLLGGRMTAGPDGGDWRVSVRLPVGGAGERS